MVDLYVVLVVKDRVGGVRTGEDIRLVRLSHKYKEGGEDAVQGIEFISKVGGVFTYFLLIPFLAAIDIRVLLAAWFSFLFFRSGLLLKKPSP